MDDANINKPMLKKTGGDTLERVRTKLEQSQVRAPTHHSQQRLTGEIEPWWDSAREALLSRLDVGKESFHQVLARMLGAD